MVEIPKRREIEISEKSPRYSETSISKPLNLNEYQAFPIGLTSFPRFHKNKHGIEADAGQELSR